MLKRMKLYGLMLAVGAGCRRLCASRRPGGDARQQ